MRVSIMLSRRVLLAAMPMLALAGRLQARADTRSDGRAGVPVHWRVTAGSRGQAARLVTKLRKCPQCLRVDAFSDENGIVSIWQQWACRQACRDFWLLTDTDLGQELKRVSI